MYIYVFFTKSIIQKLCQDEIEGAMAAIAMLTSATNESSRLKELGKNRRNEALINHLSGAAREKADRLTATVDPETDREARIATDDILARQPRIARCQAAPRKNTMENLARRKRKAIL